MGDLTNVLQATNANGTAYEYLKKLLVILIPFGDI